jgi:ATP-dependent Lon protease
MFPMEFDHRVLNTLPLPDAERIRAVSGILRALVLRRVLPDFRNRRGTDPLRLGWAAEHMAILRFEDEENRIRLVSAVLRHEGGWRLVVHERIFDYLSFVIPSDPDARLGAGTAEEHKMLAFAELLLRHAVEHVLYPEEMEREVIAADAEFALQRRAQDPTFYRALGSALADEMNGIKGRGYLALFDEAAKGGSLEAPITSILNAAAAGLEDAPAPFLQELFPNLDAELKARVLGECYRRSLNTSHTLMQRSQSLQCVLRLFASLLRQGEAEALEVFQGFKHKWGLVNLFHELNLPEASLEAKSPPELLHLLSVTLHAHLQGEPLLTPPAPFPPRVAPEPSAAEPQEKSLKDRIEEARHNPAFPRRVLEVIDRNKLNAIGHSGSKYTELIETLLAIPWGVIRPIQVTPRTFEQGLNESHYGLQGPKEILCDFFTNLIYRYQDFSEAAAASWHRTGSAFLLVGPPGVGKTSLAISVAQNLGIPYHKLSLGGMRDEADIRGHGFTYEGSKPGAIVQGLIKTGAMNSMFILDEADKTEKFAISTLLEILDPEQNHLFHDKYTQTTVDIDLSNCHFFLTANTLEGVPAVLVNRCEVILLDRYSVEEKIAIARQYLMRRVRERYRVSEEQIYFDTAEEDNLLRYMIRNYTYEAGVRELERTLRTLFLRLQRKEILTGKEVTVCITREKIKRYLTEPSRPRQINEEDAIGEMLALGVDVERGVGSVIPIQATRIGAEVTPVGAGRGHLSILHATGNIEKVMDESRKVATTGILSCAEALGIDVSREGKPVHLHFMGGSSKKDGPSAGGAIALALASLLAGRTIRRDAAMTGEIDTKGRITAVGGLDIKIETAANTGCKTVIIPRENLTGEGGIERFPEALKEELQILPFEDWAGEHAPFDYTRHTLQVVAVQNIVQAARVAFIDDAELKALAVCFEPHARQVAGHLRASREVPGLNLQAFQIKSLDELDPGIFTSPMAPTRCARALIAWPEIAAAIPQRIAGMEEGVRIFPFEPKQQQLATLLRTWLASFPEPRASPMRVALIAPFYLLMQDGISALDFGDVQGIERVSLFANNYTFQGVKFKGCKALLNQVYAVLALLDDAELTACPFLATRNGVHVVDLSFIPEKYRLDEGRAQKLLVASLTRWLDTVREMPLRRPPPPRPTHLFKKLFSCPP